MLSTYIIDDEPHAIKSLLSYIEKTPSLQLMGYNEDPLAALTHFQETGVYPDITFLDIDMPQITGIELSQLLKDKTTIVFTTAHPGFALDAFELGITDYLLKPISYQRFLKCVQKVSEQAALKRNKGRELENDFMYVQTEGKGKLIKIFFRDIIYVESQKNYVSIFTLEKKHLTYLTLAEIEEKLPSSFLRISKSYIINKDKISHIEGNEVFLTALKDGFPIGASYKEAFTAHTKEHLLKTKRS